MKINKAKLLVGTLAIASVAATVGSISGTVAWFQYSTRSHIEYEGTTAHCTESLQVSVDGTNWKQDLSATDINAAITRTTKTAKNVLTPVTSGNLALSTAAADLYSNPIYQYAGEYPDAGKDNNFWHRATNDDYVEFPVYFRVLDVDGGNSASYLAKKVYLSDVTIAAAVANTNVSNAVRVAVFKGIGTSKTGFGTYSANGNPVDAYGELDLNNDGAVDTAKKYSFETGTFTPLVYGQGSGTKANPQALSFGTAASALATGAQNEGNKIANDADPYNIIGNELGTTVVSPTQSDPDLAITVRIYVEGWAPLDATNFGAIAEDKPDPTADVPNGKPTLVWDVAKTSAVTFNVGLRFSAETHAAHN